jgi:hypothetical protein
MMAYLAKNQTQLDIHITQPMPTSGPPHSGPHMGRWLGEPNT